MFLVYFVCVYLFSLLFECVCLCIICFYLPVFMYVYILSYFVNKLEIWWLYLSPIEKEKKILNKDQNAIITIMIIIMP